VGDAVYALERVLEGTGIADITMHELGPRVEVGSASTVSGREERVEDADFVAVVEERGDDVRADEAGAAGNEDHGRER
jgi:hypothetical protein